MIQSVHWFDSEPGGWVRRRSSTAKSTKSPGYQTSHLSRQLHGLLMKRRISWHDITRELVFRCDGTTIRPNGHHQRQMGQRHSGEIIHYTDVAVWGGGRTSARRIPQSIPQQGHCKPIAISFLACAMHMHVESGMVTVTDLSVPSFPTAR